MSKAVSKTITLEAMNKQFLGDLMEYHGFLSLACLDKAVSCPDYDLVKTKLAQVNTILSKKLKD